MQAPRVQGEREAIFAFKALHRVGKPAGDERKPLTEWKAPGCLLSSKDGEGVPRGDGDHRGSAGVGPRACLCVQTCLHTNTCVALSSLAQGLSPGAMDQWTDPGAAVEGDWFGLRSPAFLLLAWAILFSPPGGTSGSVFPDFQKSAPV